MTATPSDSPSGKPESTPGHVSFVQRLKRHYGRDVDPQIHLQSRIETGTDVPERKPSDDSSSSGSSTSRGLYHKLSTHFEPGQRYQIQKEIARGGMGTILRVWDDDLRRNLAMKVMIGSGRRYEGDSTVVDEEKLGRFLEEAQITGQLDHPGVVPVHDLGIDAEGRLYFTMRLVRGRELKEVLELTHKGEEGWTMTRALGLILKLCETMAFAHSKGVVHRDLKPSNVMVGRFGEVYVMDWGLARVLGRRDSHDLRLKAAEEVSAMSLVRTVRRDESESNPDSPLVTMDGDVVGTPSYMALEQAQGKLEEVGPRSDVYSLGCILYFMVTGKAPYVEPGERVSPHTVLNRVLTEPPVPVTKMARDSPAELVAICQKAMARHAHERYSGMLELAEDIQAFLENRVVGAYEGGATAEFRKWVVRNKGMALATAGLILVAIASALGFALQKGSQVQALNQEKAETSAARDEAQRNADEAERNLERALRSKQEADTNAEMARRNSQLARRSGYQANIVAADYSLRLNDVREARERLEACDSGLRGWEYDHLQLEAHPSMQVFGPFAYIDSTAFTPDGTKLVYLSRAGRVRMHDVATGEPIETEQVISFGFNAFRSGEVSRSLAVSPDGALLALAGGERRARLFDTATGGEVLGLPPRGEQGHAAATTFVTFAPDGSSLATAAVDGEVLLWSLPAGRVLQRLAGTGDRVRAVAYSPDGERLATACDDDKVRVWDLERGRLEYVLEGHLANVWDVDWRPDGQMLASCGADSAVILWDAVHGRLERSLAGHDSEVMALDFHPDGSRLVTAGADRTMRVWDVEGRGVEVLRGHEEAVLDALFSPDGELILSGSADNTARLWSTHADQARTTMLRGRSAVDAALDPERRVTILDFQVRAVAFHPDGSRIATGATDELVCIWDAVSNELLSVLRGHEGPVTSLAYSPDGTMILSGGFDKTARVWDARSGQLLHVLSGHEKWVSAVAFSPDGRMCVTGAGDQKLRAWDASTGEMLKAWPGHKGRNGWIMDVEVHPDGELIASAAGDKRIHLWRLDRDKPVQTLTGHTRSVSSLDFESSGRLLLSGSLDSTARLWDLESMECVGILRGHAMAVYAVAFSPDGTRFVTGSADEVLRLWDTVSGETLLTRSAGEIVQDVVFSPDGKRLLLGTERSISVLESEDALGRRPRRLEASERWGRLRPYVKELFDLHFYSSEVLLRIEADRELDDSERETAVRIARVRGDDPRRLDEESRTVVLASGRDPAEYSRALRRARVACELDGRSARLQCTLGMAQVRTGRFEEAVSSLLLAGETDELDHSQRSDPVFNEADRVVRLCYLAMAHAGVGDLEAARRDLADARLRVRGKPELSYRQDVVGAISEASSFLDQG